MDEMEKQVDRFNMGFAVIIVLTLVADVLLVWGFARVLQHVKPLL